MTIKISVTDLANDIGSKAVRIKELAQRIKRENNVVEPWMMDEIEKLGSEIYFLV